MSAARSIVAGPVLAIFVPGAGALAAFTQERRQLEVEM